MNKKDFPLVILKALQSFVNRKGETFNVIEPKDALLKVVDNDDKSTFYFHILEYKKQENTFKLLMDRKPSSNSNHSNYSAWIEPKDLEAQFNTWLGLLDEYNKIESFFDDPILKTFTEEFYTEFEFVDEESQRNPLTTNQILLLDEHLEYIEQNIEKYQTEKNKTQIQEIKNDVIELRENLINPKAWVGKKLSVIWAKLAKQGPKFIKDFLVEGKKQIIIESVKFVLNHGHEIVTHGKDLLP